MFSSDREVSPTSYNSLLAALLQLADARLSATQKLVLIVAHELLKHTDLTVTALADQVSRRSGVPYSTTKWNLRALKHMGLLKGGNLCSKGENACLTSEARTLAVYFELNQ